MGAWASSAVVLVPLLPAGTPGFVVLPVMMLAGIVGGAAWGFIPRLAQGAASTSTRSSPR